MTTVMTTMFPLTLNTVLTVATLTLNVGIEYCGPSKHVLQLLRNAAYHVNLDGIDNCVFGLLFDLFYTS